jgi:hypothetical protein
MPACRYEYRNSRENRFDSMDADAGSGGMSRTLLPSRIPPAIDQ